MPKFINPTLRKILASQIAEARIENLDGIPTLLDIDEIGHLIDEIRINTRQKNDDFLQFEIELLNLVYLMYSYLILGLSTEDNFYFFPDDWLGVNFKPEPNFALQNSILLSMNNVLAANSLVFDGFDKQAHPLVRSIYEYNELLVVLIWDKDLMKIYYEPKSAKREKEYYFKFFNHKKLNKKVTEIENHITDSIYPDFTSMSDYRDKMIDKYSRSVHPSTSVSLYGGHVVSINNKDNLNSSWFGEASADGKPILRDICISHIQTVFLIKTILEYNKDLNFPTENKFFEKFLFLYRCIIKASLEFE